MTNVCMKLLRVRSFRLLALISFIVVLAIPFTIAFAGSASDSVSGTVDDIDWEGTASLSWTSGSGGWIYSGAGLTTADASIDHLYVSTIGSESCYIPFRVVIDTDWNKTNDGFNTWTTGQSGSGWISNGVCSIFPTRKWLNAGAENATTHQVWEGSDHDSGSTDLANTHTMP